jgi:hypothetical protein
MSLSAAYGRKLAMSPVKCSAAMGGEGTGKRAT